MKISNTKVHENLVALSAILTANENCLSKQLVTQVDSEADVIQISRFTTSVGNICNELQRIKKSNMSADEYNERIRNIHADIKCINDIGVQLGFVSEIITTPTNLKETIDAALAVHYNVALPYLLNTTESSNIDYAEYIIRQEEKNFFARAMKQLNLQASQNEKHNDCIRDCWKAQMIIVKNYNSLAYAFLDGCEMVEQYEKQIRSYEAAPQDLETLKKLIDTEKRMLKAGHVDVKRQTLLGDIMKYYASNMNMNGVEAPYLETVRIQKKELPTFTIGDLESCAGIVKVSMNTMNEYLRKVNVMPLITSLNALDILKAGKLICDFTLGIVREQDGYADDKHELAVQRLIESIAIQFDTIRRTQKSDIRNRMCKDIKQCIDEIIVLETYGGDIKSNAAHINQRRQLTMLDNTIVKAIGQHLFSTEPQDMLDIEVDVATIALKAMAKTLENGENIDA